MFAKSSGVGNKGGSVGSALADALKEDVPVNSEVPDLDVSDGDDALCPGVNAEEYEVNAGELVATRSDVGEDVGDEDVVEEPVVEAVVVVAEEVEAPTVVPEDRIVETSEVGEDVDGRGKGWDGQERRQVGDPVDIGPESRVCPTEIDIKFVPVVGKFRREKKDTIAFMAAHADKFLTAGKAAKYYMQSFRGGYFIEAHLGGAYRPVVPDLIAKFEENENEIVFVKTALGRFWEVRFDRGSGRFEVLCLPQHRLPPKGAVFAEPRKKGVMKPFEDTGAGLLVGGVIVAGIGVIALGVSFFLNMTDLDSWMHPRMELGEIRELPIHQYTSLVTKQAERKKVNALVYKNRRWEIVVEEVGEKSIEQQLEEMTKVEEPIDAVDPFEGFDLTEEQKSEVRRIAEAQGRPISDVFEEYRRNVLSVRN